MIDPDNVVISVDKDVSPEPVKRIRGLNMQSPIVLELQKLDLGDSWFEEGATKKDVRPYIDTGRKLGMYIMARETESDVVYVGKAGTRLWYRPDSERPQRKGQKGNNPPAHELDDQGYDLSTRRYWHHAESSCVGICEPGEPFPPGESLAEPIDEETYHRLQAEYDDDL